MQIPRQPEKLKAGCGEFLKREIEKSLVIGFEDYLTAGSKQFFIYFKEAAIGQPSLVISLFRPRIGEVQIYPGYRTVRKKFLQAGSVGVYQFYVLYIFGFQLFGCKQDNVRDLLHRNKISVRISFRTAENKCPFSASDLKFGRKTVIF